MYSGYNLRSPAVKRLMKEAQELSEPTELFHAQPLEDNLFEWHFTIRGPADSEFEGGIYHGRIILPPEYPMKPPSIMMLTPNGRFEIYKKICLSISGHHPESWQPSWSIRTAMLAIVGFMPTHGQGAIGSLDYPPDERKILARKSTDWKCPNCGSVKNALKSVTDASKKDTEEAKELATQIDFQGEKEKKASEHKGNQNVSNAASSDKREEESAPVTTSPVTTSPTGITAINYSQFYGGSFPMMPQNMPIMPYIPPQLLRDYYNNRLKYIQDSQMSQGSMAQLHRPQHPLSPTMFTNPPGWMQNVKNQQMETVHNMQEASTGLNSFENSDTATPKLSDQLPDGSNTDTGDVHDSSNNQALNETRTALPGVRQRNVVHPQQRNVVQPQQNPAEPLLEVNQPAEFPTHAMQRQQNPITAYFRSENKIILFFILLLTLGIMLLMARRILKMHIWKFDTEFDNQ